MKLTTIPSQIKPPRSEDWLINGEKYGTIATDEATGLVCATIKLDQPALSMTGWVTGCGKTREEAATDCLRKLSMCGYEVSRIYTTVVTEINK